MCGRYARKSAQELLAEWFDLDLNLMPWFTASYNAAPQSFQPVVWLDPESSQRRISLMRWGLVPSWAKDERIGLSTINARAEEAAAKPAFREALKKRRCLIPADAYYEWAQLGAKKKQPYAIALTSGEPIAFAGLWESWHDTSDNTLETFTILTTTANERLASIHDRMPVIVAPKNYERWLNTDCKSTPSPDLLQPYPAEEMEAWTVSVQVGNAHNNDPELLALQEPGQGTLFC
jgi:putative SOS response-associated peptidase YedK